MLSLTIIKLYHPKTEKGEPQETPWGPEKQHQQQSLHFPAKQVSAPRQDQTCSNTSYGSIEPDPASLILKTNELKETIKR